MQSEQLHGTEMKAQHYERKGGSTVASGRGAFTFVPLVENATQGARLRNLDNRTSGRRCLQINNRGHQYSLRP